MNASRLKDARAGDGEGGGRSLPFAFFSRFAWRLLRSSIISMLSICLRGIAGSTGSALTGVDGGGVWGCADACERETERVLVSPAGGAGCSGGSAENGRVVGGSWCVRNWRIWSLCRRRSSLVSPIDSKTCDMGETGSGIVGKGALVVVVAADVDGENTRGVSDTHSVGCHTCHTSLAEGSHHGVSQSQRSARPRRRVGTPAHRPTQP